MSFRNTRIPPANRTGDGSGFVAGAGAAVAAGTARRNPARAALRAAIATLQGQNPHLRARVTGRDLLGSLLAALPEDQADRSATVLAMLGALAGFSTVHAMVLRIEDGSLSLQAPEVLEMTLTDGTKRYFGTFLSRRLVEQPISLFNLTAGMAQQLGATTFPDLHELFSRVATSVATPEFGRPTLPPGQTISDTPLAFVQRLFPGCLPVLGRFDLHPDDHFAAFGFAIQQVIRMAEADIDPAQSVRIVMECAVPMSRLDPRSVMPAG